MRVCDTCNKRMPKTALAAADPYGPDYCSPDCQPLPICPLCREEIGKHAINPPVVRLTRYHHGCLQRLIDQAMQVQS